MTDIRFTLSSEAYYSPDELEDLKSTLVGAAYDLDDEVNQDSAKIEIITDGENDEAAKLRASVIEVIRNGVLTVNLKLEDSDEEMLFESGDVEIAL